MEEEKILIKKAQEGDNKAYEAIYNKYFKKVYRYCIFNVESSHVAQDICQESFVKAWKSLGSFKTDGAWSIQAFLFKIARNLIIDLSRKKKEYPLEDYENLPTDQDLYTDIDKKTEIEKVRLTLQKLDEIERQIIVLRYFEEMDLKEVAKIVGVNDGALRVRAHRILQKMKDIMEATYGRKN